MTEPATASRNRWGDRVYPIPTPGSTEPVRLPSVSNILKALPAPGLETWKQKTVAWHVATNPDLQALAASGTGVKGDGSKPVYAAVKQALERERSAANLGTAAHSFTEKVDAGTYQPTAAPAAVRSLMERYAQLIDEHQVTIVASEVTVYNHQCGYAGTADRYVQLPDLGVLVADYKTGADTYGDVALQLAAYANAEGIWDGERHLPMPQGLRTDLGLVIHCPAHTGTAELLVVELGPAWPTFQALTVTRRWQDEHSKAAIQGPHTASSSDGADARNSWLKRRLAAVRYHDERAFGVLAAEWPDGVPTPKERALTHPELDRVTLVLRDVEARFAVPFGETDPAAATSPSPVYANEARIGALRSRWEQLPRDLAATIKTGSPVPPGAVMILGEWATALEQAVAAAELEATDRGGIARLILNGLDPDVAATLAVDIVAATGPLWSDAGLDMLTAAVDQQDLVTNL